MKGSPIVTKHSPADLKTYLYGDQIGTTGLTFIDHNIQPTQQPKVFDTLSRRVAALEAHRIDATVTDTPTAQYMATQQIKHAVLVAQFPTVGEHYGAAIRQGQPARHLRQQGHRHAQGQRDAAACRSSTWASTSTFPTIKP